VIPTISDSSSLFRTIFAVSIGVETLLTCCFYEDFVHIVSMYIFGLTSVYTAVDSHQIGEGQVSRWRNTFWKHKQG